MQKTAALRDVVSFLAVQDLRKGGVPPVNGGLTRAGPVLRNLRGRPGGGGRLDAHI